MRVFCKIKLGLEQPVDMQRYACSGTAGLVNVRTQMLCLVADAYLDVLDKSIYDEACRRFARTLLMSREQAVTEFGSIRKAISSEELDFGKYHYGLQKYEVMSRLLEVGSIDEQLYQNYMNQICQQGYPSARDSMAEALFFYEKSALIKRKFNMPSQKVF